MHHRISLSQICIYLHIKQSLKNTLKLPKTAKIVNNTFNLKFAICGRMSPSISRTVKKY